MMTFQFPREILRFPTLSSTNDKAKELARKGVPEGTCVVAEMQDAGRGRGQHNWLSPRGGLYLSMVLSPPSIERPTDLSLLAGAAVTQAVRDCLPKHKEVSVKWPNDCLVNGRKVAGVLSESVEGAPRPSFVVGIGLNVNTAQADLDGVDKSAFPATSLLHELGGTLILAKVEALLLAKFAGLYELYRREGFKAIQFIWERNCRFIGRKVQVTETGKPEEKRAPIVGTFLGIDETGALVLSQSAGEHHRFYTGEITCFWP
jgi:BirA family transcriptional regulator, biotin operon repressor / biotin---[acetyl-CoA-carboxylase] ligase